MSPQSDSDQSLEQVAELENDLDIEVLQHIGSDRSVDRESIVHATLGLASSLQD